MAAEPGPGFRWGVLLRKSKPREKLVDGVKVFEFEDSMDAHELELVQHLRSNRMGVIVETYKEIASAYKRGASRPRYKHALSDLEAGTIDGIAVLAVDRLTRRRDQTRPILNALEQMGGRLFALWDELDTASDDPDTELRLHELVARAEREAERTAKRYKLAAQHRAHKGLPQRGGVRPYGHTDDWRSLVPVEAENLHKAALQIVEGKSPLAIARDWTEREIPTVRGGSVWWHGNLREMLRSARMIGKREYDGALITMPGVPPILDEELWRQVREILTPSYRTMGRRESRQCSNLALCSVCGLPLVSNIEAGRPTYTCKKRRSQPGACGSVSISGKRLDERVSGEVVAFLNDKPRVRALLDAHKMTGPEMEAIDARFAELEDDKLALEGTELFEVETEKIDGAVESPAAGVLRRRVAEVGAVVPVGGLVGVLADPSVPDADVDAFIAEFQASFVPEEAAEEAEAPTATVEVGGRRQRYLERGPEAPPGDPVVLLHGFGGDLNNWLFNTDKLAERRRVYALDLPGHGESAKDVGAGDLAEFAGVLGGFLDAVGAGRAHLAGHSMGGAVALAFALEHPDRVASLALVAPAGLGEEINADYIDGFVAAERRRELKGVLELLFADQGLVNRTMVDDVLRYKRLDGAQEALTTVAAAMYPSGRQTAVLTGQLDRLTVPVLVVWGEQDRVLPPAHAEALAGHARVELLAGAGHSPHMEAANEVNRLVVAFLDEQEPP